MIYALVVAGGSGSRMGGAVPKQFLPLDGVPILIHTLQNFQELDGVCVLVPELYVKDTQAMLQKYDLAMQVTAGGKDRMESVELGYRALQKIWDMQPDDVILTHDGVRPFLTKEIIRENIRLAQACGAAGTFLQAVDTIAISKDGMRLQEVPDRSQFYLVQTPQTFRASVLERMLQAEDSVKQGCTDLCGLAGRMGIEVSMCRGDGANIKITTPFDLTVAQAFLHAKKGENQ